MKIRMISDELLSDNWYILRKYVFDLPRRNGGEVRQMREVYDRGNGATILLYSRVKQSVILTRQFRLPTYLNGNQDGMLLETCAGLLDGDDPEACVRREAMEETGFHVGEVTRLFEAYMSPGSVTELVYFFAAEYDPSQRTGRGGGIEDEDIEVIEMPFSEALAGLRDGRIKDGKTIILLQHAQLQGWLSAAEVR